MSKYVKGLPRPEGAGRRAGVPNKVTDEVKSALQMLVTSSLPQMQNWLDEVAKDSPAKALELVLKMSEFVLPKVGRVEHMIEQRSMNFQKIEVNFV